MKTFLNFPNGVNSVNGVYKNFKINVDAIAGGAYYNGSDVSIPLTAGINLVLVLELEAGASDAKVKAFANAINNALISNPGVGIIDLPNWLLSNVELTNP